MIRLLCGLLLFFTLVPTTIVFPAAGFERVLLVLSVITLGLFVVQRITSGASLRPFPQQKWILAIVCTYTLSIAQGLWLGGTIETLAYWAKKAILLVLIANLATSAKQVRFYIWVVIVAVTVLIWNGWDIYWHYPMQLVDEGRLQSIGDYNLSNSFALALTMSVGLAFGLLETEKGLLRKVVLLSFVVASVISCAYTKSRGGNLGMFATVGASLLLSRRLLSVTAIKVAAFALCGVIMIGASVPIILSRSDVTSYVGDDVSADDRLLAWKAALRMTADRPLLGMGWRSFNEHVRDYGHDKKLLAHNTVLSVMAETGIPGAVFFLCIFVGSLRWVLRVRRKWLPDEDEDHRALALLAQATAICLIGFFINTSFSVKDHDPMYWAALSFAAAITASFIAWQKTAENSDPANSPALVVTADAQGGAGEPGSGS